MIITMSKLRLIGPRERLADVLQTLQDLGMLHLAAPRTTPALAALELSPAQERERRHLREALRDVEWVLAELGSAGGGVPAPRPAPTTIADRARWARLGRRVRRAVERLKVRTAALQEERALILKYQGFFAAFRSLLESETRWPNATVHHVLLKSGDADVIRKLRTSLASVVGDAFELYTQPLPTGEVALLVVASTQASVRVERLLADAQVQEIPLPAAYGGTSLAAAMPRMLARLAQIPADLDQVRHEREALARTHGAALRQAHAGLHDRLQELEALPLSAVTPRAFVLEGWVPAPQRRGLETRLNATCGEAVVVSEISTEEWKSEEAPVVLSNPRLFRPFEALIRLMPLPSYGTIDPTPFVAVFFPVFFGLIVGDVGYGALLAALGLLLYARSQPGTVLRNVAEITGPCALFSILAGFLYGELFGDLGKRWFGLKALAFSREEALIPFLLLAVALGVVHILLGLGLGVASNLRAHPRAALGRGVSALMIVLILLALLAAVDVLPRGFFTPAVLGLLVAFPVLIVLEGVVGPIEFLSTIGNILSYTRIMALGVASVMLAVVANRMVGAIGSVAVGVVFALLFHLVNFAITLFTPTIHALRLQYVEFFGKFYSPGGVQYHPFGRWTRDSAHTGA